MKPIFSVRYLTGNVAPASVEFKDMYEGNPEMRITVFDFGDGHVFQWDYKDQMYTTHTYTKAGKWQAKALHNNEMSDVTVIEIVAIQAPESIFGKFIAWLKKLFGIE